MKAKNLQLKNINLPILAAGSLFFLLIGELAINGYIGNHTPGYNWKLQSISYLGQQSSPYLPLIKTWSIIFSLTYCLIATLFYKSFKDPSFLVVSASILFIIYGLGEGVGSGFFPVTLPGNITSRSSNLHQFFGGVADVAIYSIPILMLFEFPLSENRLFHIQTYIIISFALLFCIIFLIAKYLNINSGLFSFRGLWQRLFLLCLYIYYNILIFKISI